MPKGGNFMFGRKKEEKSTKSLNIDSLIGENIKFIGKIEGSGNLRIDGIVEGDIAYNGSIVLGDTGKIKGNVDCDDITVAGEINGNVNTKDKLTLLPTSSLVGDIKVESLVIHEEAKFEGNCKMIITPNNIKPLNTKKSDENKQEIK